MNEYIAVLKKYADFKGRSSRREFWMFTLFNFLISLGLSILTAMIGFLGFLQILYGLAVLVPGIAVGVRRLHDVNKSGWWLASLLIGVFLGLIAAVTESSFVGALAAIAYLGAGVTIIVFACFKGDEGDNKYGPAPTA